MRHLRHLILPLLLVVALAAACGGDDGDSVQAGGDGGDAATTTTVDPDTAVSSPSSLPGTDEPTGPTWTRIEPTDDLLDPVVATPEEIVPDPDDPNAVLVRFYGGVQECYGARARVFGEDDTVVRILLETGSQPDAGDQPCIEIAESQELQVVLDAPVGDRELLAADSADEGDVGTDG
jgi:hypothetical protein